MTSAVRYISAFFVIVLVSLLVACGASTPAPLSVVTVSSLPAAVVNSSYSATLQANSGTPPYTWAVTSGSLPPGLTLNASTGVISGTPTAPTQAIPRKPRAADSSPTTYSFTVTVTDSSSPAKTASASMQIVVNPVLALTTASLPAGVVGTAYSQTLAATGGITPYTWAVTTGSLPAGLSLNASTGAITGTPTGPQVGTISFTVMVTDSESPTKTATANLSISISAPTLTVTTSSLTGGTLGTAYSQGLTATGGVAPYSWAVTIGSLPAGLMLNGSTGQITGTPTGNVTGPINFGVTVTDSETPTTQASEANLSIAITAPPLSVTTSSLATGVVQSAYSATLQATGGVSPYTWSVTTGTLPAGLSLNAATGAISGAPTTAGTSPITVTVSDSETPTAKTATANLSIVVNPKLAVTTTSLGAAVVGTAYNQTLAATGGITPYTWAVTTGSLPAGLSLNTSTGAITGTPAGPQVGAINFTVTVTDAESPTKTATANLSITVSAPPLSVTTASLAGGTLGTSYSATLGATGGITPYTWSVSVGVLPAGLTLNASTGQITGTPTGNMTGPINFTVKVTDSEQPTAASATAALSITITAPPLSVVTSSLPTGVAQSVYPGATLQATGGVSPYTWSVTTGSLPAGLSLNSSTGAISGTPTASGPFTFTVTATDSEIPTPQTAAKQLSITINPQLTVTTSSLAAAVVGTAYNQTLAATGGITPYTWAVTTGSLPAGLSLNASTGAITGTPTGPQVGAINFTVTATDSESPTKTASANLSITVSAPPLSVSTSSLTGGTLGTAYSATLAATGGITPYTWSVSVGALPAGLTLNTSTGQISGTSTGSVTGPINFTVKVTDAELPTGATATAALSITIAAAPLSVVTSSLPNGVAQSVYAGATLQAAGGVSPYTWTVTPGSLPAGLSLNGSTGAISGTPTALGTTTFTVTVTDSETPTAQTATKQLSITVNPQLSVTTSSLAGGVVGTAYNQTLAATGGLTPYSWAVTVGSLPAGLSLNSSTGAITGTPTGPFVGTTSFTVTVTDSESPIKTATASLSITISAPTLTITTTSLPTGVKTQAYSAALAATGGVTPYTWSIKTGSLPAGLSLNTSTGVISGTPTATGPSNFTIKVTDSETPTAQSATANLSIAINNSSPLQIITSALATGVISTAYSDQFAATGGIQPYTWSIFAGNLPPGLLLNTSTGAITGAPTSMGTFNFTAKVTDSSSPSGSVTANLSITVDAGLTITTTSLPSGSVGTQYPGTVSAAGGIEPYTWSIISGNLPPGLSAGNNNDMLSFSGQPTTAGTYNFTVQVSDSEPSPASLNGNFTIVINNTPVGYTVSGTLSYGGSKTGQVYLLLNPTNCNNGCSNQLGTSITDATLKAGGAFTIHGVLPGTYMVQAYMDNLGYGAQNASNPTGSASNINVVNSNVSGVSVPLNDPGTVTLNSAPSWKAGSGEGGFNGGAFASFSTIKNNNGIEMPASYTVQWSTSSSFGSIAGSKSFPATGKNNPWLVTGLTNGTTYYFRAEGVAGGSTSSWSGASPGVLVGSPTGGNAISGTVTFTGTAKGPLYVGFYDQNTGNVYAEEVASPKSPQAYSVSVPTGSNYFFFGVIDNNNNGLLNGAGQISNTNENNMASIAITGPTTTENLTLPSANSQAEVTTQSSEYDSGSPGYSIGFTVDGLFKLPVAVELTTGPSPGVVLPVDIANNTFYGGQADAFNYYASLNGATPNVGDSYTLNVTYSDGTSENINAAVSAVLNAFATNLSPQGNGVSLTPNFSWTDPTNPGNYTYQFYLQDQNGNMIWQIPGNNSNSNGFSSSITSITWNVDPTGSGDLPSVSSLNGSTTYYWYIQATDVNGNSALAQVSFNTVAAPLTLPAAGNVGNATVGQSWNGAINASGGTGPNYSFTVNGNPVPTDGTQVSLGNNLFAWNTGGNTLSLGGTPTSPGPVSFTVAVTDSASVTTGPYTYTITVNTPTPLSLQTTAMPGGDQNWAYNAKLQANGGVQPYTWSVIGGNLPAGLSISTDNGGNGIISGTPSATGTASFTVQVTDSSSVSASGALSITIGNCGNNANLNGHYAFTLNGWKSATDFQTTIGSFVANGTGSISSGLLDINDQNKAPVSATATGTYCVSSNNLVAISLTASGGASGTAVFEAALDTTGNGHIIRYDATSTEISSGLLRKQTTTAFSTSSIKNNFAFGMIGVDPGSDNRFGMAGEFNSNGSGTLSGELDGDNSSNGSVNATLSASNFNVASSGRGTASMNLVSSQGSLSLNLVFYVVNAGEMLMMEDDSGNLLMAGQALQQSASLTNASLKGNSVIELEGADNSGGTPVSDIQAGIIDASGSGTFSLTMDENDGGSFDGGTGTPQSISGDYSVATNGRVTLSNITGGGGGNNHVPVFYLVGLNQAFVIGTDGSVTFGTMTPQTVSSFTNASLNGNFLGGSQQPVDTNASVEVDQAHADGSGNFTGASDDNNQCGSGGGSACPQASSIAVTYSVSSNGRVTVSQGGQEGGIMYIISSSQVVFMSTQDNNATLQDFHQ
ncbi:MAG: putative Ig domain-containing protein [Terriglobales bacterium]